jgi:hypothetical protein
MANDSWGGGGWGGGFWGGAHVRLRCCDWDPLFFIHYLPHIKTHLLIVLLAKSHGPKAHNGDGERLAAAEERAARARAAGHHFV